jgi:hypothetical protein
MKKILLFTVLVLTGTSIAQTYNFTSCGITGRTGPTQGDVNTTYAATNLNGMVTITTQGIQEWVVPSTGNYQIQAVGAKGGNSSYNSRVGGNGSDITGEFNLTAGQTLYIMVGQVGESASVGGGGGGSYVVLSGTPLIVAGGGGGASSDQNGIGAVTATDGTYCGLNISAGGIAGNGGSGCSGGPQNGGGGGGFFTDGITLNTGGTNNNGFGGQCFNNGGVGGQPGRLDGACAGDAFGGFGGGGSTTCNTVAGGGGGGYSGGAGGSHVGNCGASVRSSGGGGGSFNNGTNQINLAATNTGDGYVVITSLCTPSSVTPDIANLPDVNEECSVAVSSAPSASTNCGGTITGTTTTIFPIITQGTTVVTWTYDDGNGNTASQTQNVIVADVTAPVADVTTLPDVTGVCDATPTVPTATDNCSGGVTGTPNVTFPITAQGTTVVTWTYDDGNGNVTTQTQNVILTDSEAPVPDSPVLLDYSECSEANPTAPTATDNCSGGLTGTPDVTLPITTAGTTVITWTYDDGNGNTSTQIQNITVTTIDTTVNQIGGQLNAVELVAGYQWLDCDNNYAIVPGAMNQFFTPPATGYYAVEITKNGCVDTSACHLVDFTSLHELDKTELSIYPNPVRQGTVHISYTGEIELVKVIDVTGREVLTGIETNKIDVSGLVAGRYVIQIMTDKGLAIRDLIRY